MKFKFRKRVDIKLQKVLGVKEFVLSINEDSLKEEDFGFFKSYLNKSIEKLKKNLKLIEQYSVNDYLRVQFDNAYCKLYDIEPLEINEITLKLATNVKNRVKIEEKKGILLKEGINLFLEELTLNGGIREKTFKNYKSRLKHLSDFFSEDKDLTTLRYKKEVKEFNKYLSDKVTNGTRKNILTFAKSLFNFLVKEDYLENNEFLKLGKIRYNKGTKRAFTDKEVNFLLEKASQAKKFKKYNKDLDLIFRFAAYTGARIEELVNIRLKDFIDETAFTITLEDTSTKKHKRVLPVHKNLIEEVKFLLNTKNREDYLFYNNHQGTTRLNTISKNVNGYFIRKYFTDRDISFHSFKHSVRIKMQIKHPELEKLISILTSHDTGLGFGHYGKNSSDWEKLVLLINCIDYNENEVVNKFEKYKLENVS